MVVVVAGISMLLLREASSISMELSLRGIRLLTQQRAEYWNGQMNSQIAAIRTLAEIMRNYEVIPAGERRDQFDEMLLAVIESHTELINVYTIWKPNALDGMDAQYLGRTGSSPTGQYAMAFTKETGEITSRASTDVAASMEYFNGPNSKRDRVEHPFTLNVNGKEKYLIRMMVPIIDRRTNEVIGGIGCLFDTSIIQPILENTVANNEEIAIMVMYSGNGHILAHFLPERVGRMLTDVDMEYGKNQPLAFQAVLDGTPYKDSAYDPTLGINIELNMVHINIGNSDTTWAVMLGTTDAYVLKEVRAITKFTVILAVIAVLVSAVILFIVFNYMTKPVVKVTETLKDISEGDGDLTRTIPDKGNDEIAELSRYFNLTLKKIRNLVITIKNQTVTLFDIGNELASNMTETATAVNEITANTQSIKGQVLSQSASVTQTNATMEQMNVNIDKLNEHVESQATSVAQSSSAIEQMMANIRSVSNTLSKNAENVSELTSASEVGREGLRNVATDIQEVAKESEGLLEINSVMKNIASQTNLLSMNAAIEAAHAGEAGKGFAVVAGEIRKLAEESSEQSKTISVALKKIKGSIDKITVSTGNVLNKFQTIDSGVKTVAEQEDNIRSAMEEQREGSKQILEAVGHLNELTQMVKNGSTEMIEGSREVIQEGNNLEQVTQEITGGMNEMAAGAEQINAAVIRVNEISAKNKENIELLVQEVSRFKVE